MATKKFNFDIVNKFAYPFTAEDNVNLLKTEFGAQGAKVASAIEDFLGDFSDLVVFSTDDCVLDDVCGFDGNEDVNSDDYRTKFDAFQALDSLVKAKLGDTFYGDLADVANIRNVAQLRWEPGFAGDFDSKNWGNVEFALLSDGSKESGYDWAHSVKLAAFAVGHGHMTCLQPGECAMDMRGIVFRREDLERVVEYVWGDYTGPAPEGFWAE